MDPDRFSEIEADEQRAVEAINEEYRQLQEHVPPIAAEVSDRRGRLLAAALVLLLVVVVAAVAVGVWLR